MRKIPKEIYEDFGLFVDDVIDQIVRMFECPSPDIITMLAERYDLDRRDLVKCLKAVDSKFTLNNNVIFHDGVNYVKRTTFHNQMWKTINKIGKKLKDIDPEADVGTIYDVMKDKYTIKQGTCLLR